MKIKYLLLSVFMLALWSCETDVVNPDEVYPEPYMDIDSGDADFSTYVAMGEGITAGMTDNSLFMAGQMNSYPNIMAGVMSMAGGGEFTQPYTNDNVGGMNYVDNSVVDDDNFAEDVAKNPPPTNCLYPIPAKIGINKSKTHLPYIDIHFPKQGQYCTL